MSLSDAIAEALANATPPPKNESTTCDWVIYPLLLACGYARREIESRIADNNGQFPDYAILPDSPHGWFVEAKAWTVALEDRHAQQALNYANQNGKRWVVLTNGQEWRLYDNLVQGVAADELAASARLDAGESFAEFMTALSKPSVCGGALKGYAARARLEQFLAAQLADENSEVIGAVLGVIRKKPGLSSVSRHEVAAVLAYGLDAASVNPGSAPTTAQMPALTPQQGQTVVSLDVALQQSTQYLSGRAPKLLRFPDGSEVSVKHWADLAHEAVQWLGEHQGLPPLPFRGGTGGHRFFLNSTPQHKSAAMRRNAAVHTPNGAVYVDLNRSAQEFAARICEICAAVGVPASGFVVMLRA